MYAFRDRYANEWDLDSSVEPCPPVEAVDPTLPPAARSAARKTEGLKLALAKHGFDGLIAGIRRDEEPTRAKERVFSPRGPKAAGTSATSRRNSGISSTPRRRRARIFACIRSCIGPSSTSGPTRGAKASRSSRSISRATESATARSATPTSRLRWHRMRRTIDEIIAELEATTNSGASRPRHGPRIRGRFRAPAPRRLSVVINTSTSTARP